MHMLNIELHNWQCVESQSNTCYTLVIRAMYMWQLKQSATYGVFVLMQLFSYNSIDYIWASKNLRVSLYSYKVARVLQIFFLLSSIIITGI